MKNSSKVLIGIVAQFLASAALAAPTVFDFSSLSESEGSVSSFLASESGVTATITAWRYSNSSGKMATQYDVYLDTWPNPVGIGVKSSPSDSDDLEGAGYNELLEIAFDQLVTMSSIRLLDGDHNYNFSGSDDFDLWADGVKVFNEHPIEANDINGWVSTSDLVGSTFWLGADGNNDTFYLQGFEVSGASSSEVPEPGTLALLGLGLIATGFARRKQA